MKLGELSDLLRELQAHEQALETCRSNTRIAELNSAITVLRNIDIHESEDILEDRVHVEPGVVRAAKSTKYRE